MGKKGVFPLNTDPEKAYESVVKHDNRFATGDWISGSILRSPETVSSFRGKYTHEQLCEIADVLEFLYPPEVCAEGLRNGTLPAGVHELFIPGWCHHVWTLLLLSVDLGLACGWKDDRNLVQSLRSFHSFYSRRVEVGVWAGLRRVGYDVERPEETSEKTCDFLVTTEVGKVAVEVKTVAIGDLDSALDWIGGSLSQAAMLLQKGEVRNQVEGKKIEVSLSEDIDCALHDPDRLEDTASQLVDRLEGLCDAIAETLMGSPKFPFFFEFPGVGTVHIRNSEEPRTWSIGFTDVAGATPEKQLSRTLRTVRDSLPQFPKELPSVLVLHGSRPWTLV